MSKITKTTMPEETGNMLAIISKAATDPKVDYQKMQGLLDVQERIMNKQAEMAFVKAKSKAMREMPEITKNGMIEFIDRNNVKRQTPFAKYEDIARVIKPILKKHGLNLDFDTIELDKKIKIIGYLRHELGHSISSSVTLPHDTSGSKNNLQAVGSTISYGKRYVVCNMLDIVTVDEDDDATAAGEELKKIKFSSKVKKESVQDAEYEDVAPEWDGSVTISGKKQELKTDVKGAANYLLKVLKQRKHKQSRIDIINENLTLLHALNASDMQNMVEEMHKIAGEGE